MPNMNDRRFTVATLAVLAAGASMLSACNSTPVRTQGSEAVSKEYVELRREELRASQEAMYWIGEGERLERRNKPDQAIEAYQKAVNEYHETPIAWNNLGRLLMERGEPMPAAEAFRIAADLSPADPTPVHNLGTLYESLGWPDEALQYYMSALTRNPNYPPSLRRSVMLEIDLHRTNDTTEERLERALRWEDDPRWRDLLKRAQVRLHDGSMDAHPNRDVPDGFGTDERERVMEQGER